MPKNETTPMVAQYLDIKRRYPNCLLLFRMGDFYEIFFEDASTAAPILDLALTHRGEHQGMPIPMCGMPWHALDPYLARLVKNGHHVAICEQMEDPKIAKSRPGRTLVKRDVIRVVTPGTIVEEGLLDPRKQNILSVIHGDETACVIAWVDISTGRCGLETGSFADATSWITRQSPAEILSHPSNPLPLTSSKHLAEEYFDPDIGRRYINEFWKNVGFSTGIEAGTLGALLRYLHETQCGKKLELDVLTRNTSSHQLRIDPSTWNNLDVFHKNSSLIEVIDKTLTAGGGRLLREWILNASTDMKEIKRRQNIIRTEGKEISRLEVQKLLKSYPDIERALGRLLLGRGGPRDLLSIGNGLKIAHWLSEKMPNVWNELGKPTTLNSLKDTLLNTLKDPPVPLLARDGGFVREGIVPELDECQKNKNTNTQKCILIATQLAAITGIQFKIKKHLALGILFETNSNNAEILKPYVANGTLIHRQTLAQQVRYATPESINLDAEQSTNSDAASLYEQDVFSRLCEMVKENAREIRAIHLACANIDVAESMNIFIESNDWILPTLTEDHSFNIREGRHPVVEHFGKNGFVPNDCILNPKIPWIMTGPNMAGKSTFLRQNALFILLSQAGLPVPAKEASIGIVDRLFSRIGAGDALAEGKSTFFVEMTETAAILNGVSPRSFVIIDEVGRGTSTQDGRAIAYACLEHLIQIGCRTLFATHYHEIARDSEKIGGKPMTLNVVNGPQGPVFLHQVVEGAASSSYGLIVAQRAGLPQKVLKRAEEFLSETFLPVREDSNHPLLEHIQKLDPEELTPRQAHDLIRSWQEMLNGSNKNEISKEKTIKNCTKINRQQAIQWN